MNKLFPVLSLLLPLSLGVALPCYGEQILPAIHVSAPPIIDGLATDEVWGKAREIKTHDTAADLIIALKAAYTDKEIFLLVTFPDPDESRTHKSWTWDSGREFYTVGNDREDVFVIKWSMDPQTTNLSIYADSPYLADIWYWKACRTDGAGFADDKLHIYSPEDSRDATKTVSRSGKTMYLLRNSDEGSSAYRIDLQSDYAGEILPRFHINQPDGSRADVKAKGHWENGSWTIEFRRNLLTGNHDDVQFSPAQKYFFGVSRYEIAGRDANPKLSQPLFGTGDVSESLWVEFLK
jgi:hypothetical protein